jgi:hypothetical protein
MYVDADEHIVFDGIAGHSFRDLTLTMERQGIRRVRGFLLDMYADSPLMKSTYQPHTSLFDAYPYFDTNTYVEQRYKEIISVKGGPRPRVFGGANAKFRPEMTKYPLFCSQPADYMVNPHHHWPYEENFASGRYLVILHYKFLPGIIEKIRRAVIEQNYWDGSLEYRCYLSVIESNPDVSLMGEMSARYSGPSSLLSRGLIENIPWETEHHLQRISRAAFHQRRAEIDGANGLSRHLANPAAA